MQIELIIAVIGLMIVCLGIGYLIGYRHCFDDIQAEFEKYKRDKGL